MSPFLISLWASSNVMAPRWGSILPSTQRSFSPACWIKTRDCFGCHLYFVTIFESNLNVKQALITIQSRQEVSGSIRLDKEACWLDSLSKHLGQLTRICLGHHKRTGGRQSRLCWRAP